MSAASGAYRAGLTDARCRLRNAAARYVEAWDMPGQDPGDVLVDLVEAVDRVIVLESLREITNGEELSS